MKINVAHIAQLANLTISPVEEKKFEMQLSAILDYVKKLEEVDTHNIPETHNVTGLENITRDDSTFPSLTQEEALSNASSQKNGFFNVPGILDQG